MLTPTVYCQRTCHHHHPGRLIHLDSATSSGDGEVLTQAWLLSLIRANRLLVWGLFKAILACACEGAHGIELTAFDNTTQVRIYTGGIPKAVKTWSVRIVKEACACGTKIGAPGETGGEIVCTGKQTVGVGVKAKTTMTGVSTARFVPYVTMTVKETLAENPSFRSDLAPLAKYFPDLATACRQKGPTLAQVTAFVRHVCTQDGDVSMPNIKRLVLLKGALQKEFAPDGLQEVMCVYSLMATVLPSLDSSQEVVKSCTIALYAVLQQRCSKKKSVSSKWKGEFDASLAELKD